MPLIPAFRRQRQTALGDGSQPGLQNEFHDSLSCYSEKPCLWGKGRRERGRKKEGETDGHHAKKLELTSSSSCHRFLLLFHHRAQSTKWHYTSYTASLVKPGSQPCSITNTKFRSYHLGKTWMRLS